jgi:hypothetical protein
LLATELRPFREVRFVPKADNRHTKNAMTPAAVGRAACMLGCWNETTHPHGLDGDGLVFTENRRSSAAAKAVANRISGFRHL